MSDHRAKKPLNKSASDAANKTLWEKYPELKGRKVSMGKNDYKYRKAWMEAYIESGGAVEAISPSKPVGSPKMPCKNDNVDKVDKKQIADNVKYDIVEIVEVIKQDGEKWVEGAAMETSKIANKVKRSEKDDGNYKQFINIDQNVEGRKKRHPEYGRKIIFKARIKQISGKEKLNRVSVKFSFNKVDGLNKSGAVWNETSLTGSQKEGFKRAGSGVKELVVHTNVEGWTSPVSFYLSEYGGDKFEILAELHPKMPGAGKKIKTKAKYVVWKKFWYQLTYADGFAIKDLTKAKEAYKEVFADVVLSGKKEFKKTDLPADIQDRTFYKEYMLKKGKGDNVVATIGSNNKLEFGKKPVFVKNNPKGHPLKANLIVCNYQCDSQPQTAEGIFKLTSNIQEVTLTKGKGGPIICKPAIKAKTKLIAKGEWSKAKAPWHKGSSIPEGAVEISKTRASTLTIKVDLTKCKKVPSPVPTEAAPVYIKLKLETAESYLGESFGKGQILCVYRPGTIDGKQASETDYNDTVAHELGHMWNQTPKRNLQPNSLKNHPLQYVGHGGSGPHCMHGKENYEHNNTYSDEVEPKTTITKKENNARKTHTVASSVNFNKGYTVTINTKKRKIAKVVDITHIRFTTAFKADIGDVLQQNVDWNNSTQEWPSPSKGDCIMFHSYSPRCSHKFCATCKPYLQLQKMKRI